MATFAAHVLFMVSLGPCTSLPATNCPKWAEGLVGKHCLVEVEADAPDFTAGRAAGGEIDSEGADGDPNDDADADKGEGEGEADGGDDVDPAVKTDAPDFTTPAPRRGRPRKA